MRQLLLCAVFAIALLAGCDAGGSSVPVEDDPGPPPGENPNTNASIEITAEADGEVVNLQWSGSNLDQAARYRLYRAQTAGFDTTGTFHASVEEQEYVDPDVEPERGYFYRVAAVDTAGTALALSDADEASPIDETPPAPPTGITGAGEFYRATLGWEASASDDLDGYHVYRSTRQFTDIDDAERLTTALLDTTGFVDDSALDGERYIYRITATDTNGNESEPSKEVGVTPTFSGDALRGKEVFAANCSSCHISANAWDLQAFAMPDTMIHRRALGHVNRDQALDIISFVHSGDVQPFHDADIGKKELPPFQPGDRILSSDRAFAMNLFGQDQWPEDLKPKDLLGLDPATLPLPFRLPDWNVERDESDWLPSRPLPSRIADQNNVQSALQAYRANGSDENLLAVYKAIHDVDRGWRDRYPFKPEVSPEEMAEVYELNRWISSLVAMHVLRKGGDEIESFRRLMSSTFRSDLMEGDRWAVKGKHRSLVSELWAVGDIMRMHGPDSNKRMPDRYGTGNREIKFSTIRWFYLSWMVRPEGESSFAVLYFPRLLTTAGYPRVAAFFAAHMVVNGKLGYQKVYDVLVDYPYSVGEKWIPNLTRFIVDAYVDRIERGDFARGDTHHQRNHFSKGINRVINSDKYVTEEEKDYLREKRDFILNWLKEQENSSG